MYNTLPKIGGVICLIIFLAFWGKVCYHTENSISEAATE